MGITIHYKATIICTGDELVQKLSKLAMLFSELKNVEVSRVIETPFLKEDNSQRNWWSEQLAPELAENFDLEVDRARWFIIQSGITATGIGKIIGLSTVLNGPCHGSEPFNLPFTTSKNTDGKTKWKLHSFTKTQYAKNFMVAHQTVIAMLDGMKAAGFKVEVHDEAGYYEDRDLDSLKTSHVESEMFIRMIGGILKETLGNENVVTGYDD